MKNYSHGVGPNSYVATRRIAKARDRKKGGDVGISIFLGVIFFEVVVFQMILGIFFLCFLFWLFFAGLCHLFV